MIKLYLILLLPFTLYASKILSYNIYDRTDRVDVMITFDTPYSGAIKQYVSQSKITIKLEDAMIESSKVKKLSSKFLQSLNITPLSGYTQIVATVPPSVKLQASKTSDAYGLRLRFSNKIAQKVKQTESSDVNPLAALPTKRSDDMSQSYYIVIAILLIGIIILFVLKKQISQSANKKKQNSWLFKENSDEVNSTTDDNVSIRFQKTIDSENSVVMLDFGPQSYFVLMGKNNILLDKFTDNQPTTQEDFETILQNRHKELDEFLQVENTKEQEPFQAYREKASISI